MSTSNMLGVVPASFLVGTAGVTKDTLVIIDTAADDTVTAMTATTDNPVGVALSTEVSGATVGVQTAGKARIIYGGTVTRGDLLMFGTGAKAITRTSTNTVIGIALKSGVANDVGEVLLCHWSV